MTLDQVPATHRRETAVAEQLARLTLSQKVRLLTGSSAWTLHPIASIGLRGLVVSDGPAGVRGVTGLATETAACFPSPSAVSATWDRDLIHRVGELFAVEARRHRADVVLAPVVNLQRTPVGGRHFECFSEDPLLTGEVAATLVSTMQHHGVGACVKHFVANDSETARTEYVARIDPRTLREVYLAPFETVVRDAGVWMVMAAYNGLDDGVETNSATEHRRLLHDLLKTEWGFDGVVVSDWTAATSTAASANAGLDLVMPGPGGPWEDALLKAVRSGEVDTATVDDKVRRVLRLAHRTGAVEGVVPAAAPLPEVTAPALLRELAARSTVVVKDTPRQLPHDPAALRSVALIGPNAVDAFLQGGGSAHVNPDRLVTPEAGLRAALPAGTTLTVHRGGYSRPHLPDLDLSRARRPGTDAPGVRVDFLDAADAVVDAVDTENWTGWIRTGVPEAAVCARLTTRVRLSEPGTHRIGVGTVGVHRVLIDGVETAAGTVPAGGEVVLNSSVNAPPSADADVVIVEPRDVEVVAHLQILDAEGWGRFVRAALRHRLPGPDVGEEIAAAEAAARSCDLAVVVVGTNNEVESEGWDRTGLGLPGRQDELVRRVAAAAPRTVVVVNAGAPVLLPWLDEVDTVLWTWFPGQECGHALADTLFGVTEPSGRLPWTLPASADDVPVPHAIPDEGVVDYAEGIHIGYRAYLRDGITAAAPFGHGVGWTDWRYDSATAVGDPDGATVTVAVTNTGPRAGREVVQVYLSTEDTTVERPSRWLAGFATVDAEPGAPATATVTVRRRAFEVWDETTHAWRSPTARYTLHIGRSATDIRTTVDLTL